MAPRYFVNGGVDSNWGTTGNWSGTSGGAGGSSVPTASDDVFLDASSPNCTVNTSARVALTLNFTGYTNTITMSQQITVSGSVTLVAAMTISGSGALLVNATATLTSNGKTWPNAMTMTGTATYTWADNWAISGLFTTGSITLTTTHTGAFTITMGAGMSIGGTFPTIAVSGSSPTFSFAGTGSWTQPSGATFRPNVTFTSGTITLPANALLYSAGTITYVGGTMVTTGNVLTMTAATTLNTAGMTWNSISTSGSTTITISADVLYSGTLTNGSGSSNIVWTGAFNIRHTGSSGGYTMGTTNTSSGTGNFVMEGTGNITGTSAGGGKTHNNFTVNTAGTYTFVTAWGYGVGTFTWTAGTSAGNVPLVVNSGTTTVFTGTQDILWSTISINNTGATTVTLSDSLKCSGLCTVGATTNPYTINGGNIYAAGGFRFGCTTGTMVGTTTINLTGTGTVDAPSVTTGRCLSKLVLNAPGGTITIDGTSTTVPFWDLSNVLFTAGTIVTDAGTWASGGGTDNFAKGVMVGQQIARAIG